TRERLSQIMELVWLAPDIQRGVLYLPPVPGGRYPIAENAVRQIASHFSWAEQRTEWDRLKERLKGIYLTNCVCQLDSAHFDTLIWPPWKTNDLSGTHN